MAFEGSLEDLAITDVIQLLHVSRKTGILRLSGSVGETCITFSQGDIVGANHPAPEVNIGLILVEMNLVVEDDIQAALQQQKVAGENRKPLVTTLVEMNRLQPDQGWQALERLIERTVLEVVSWKKGIFSFEVGQIVISDDFRHFPEGMAPKISLDTQSLLMDAIRILDERNRVQPESVVASMLEPTPEISPPPVSNDSPDQKPESEPEPEVEPEPEADFSELPAVLPGMPSKLVMQPVVEQPSAAEIMAQVTDIDEAELLASIAEEAGRTISLLRTKQKAVLFCSDGFVKMSLQTASRAGGVDAFISEIEHDILLKIENTLADNLLPAVVLDCCNSVQVEQWSRRCGILARRIRRIHPEVPLVFLTHSSVNEYQDAFRLGARAVLPKPVLQAEGDKNIVRMKAFLKILMSCLQSIFEEHKTLARRVLDSHAQMAMLKRRVQEIQDRKASPDISLVVLQYMADYLERCIIFLVRKDDLLGLGAFGVDENRETLSSAVMRLKIPLGPESVLQDVIENGRVFQGEIDSVLVNDRLYKSIGAPTCPNVLLVPLRTEKKTVALIYGDFGYSQATPVHTDALEILASQAGMAFELALTSRQVPEN